MKFLLVIAITGAVAFHIIDAARNSCPNNPHCICESSSAVELECDIGGKRVMINFLPNTYLNINCEETKSLDYDALPKCANRNDSFKSVSFKDCPLPDKSLKAVMDTLGVSKTMALIFQNSKNLSRPFERKHFSGLENLTKLLLSINGVTRLPDNLFVDMKNLTWLNIRSKGLSLSEELFKPLERLETLEISHNYMTNISSNLFSHLSYLRKLSLWQSNVSWFSKDLFTGVDVLEELDLSSNGLNELPAAILKPLRKLRKLTLFSNRFSSLPFNLFYGNKELETVVILNNDVKIQNLPKRLFANLSNLKFVYIQKCGLENLAAEVFSNSSSITNISLAHNDIETLPESVFNDQINLLELDLSYNKLKILEDKLFSSLVRLETLDLRNNELEQLASYTFTSLLSLNYLNIDHNKLKSLPENILWNNKQKLSISLAFNKLDFDCDELVNRTWTKNQFSPFSHILNMKLLNLSHNEIQTTFRDWWTNRHEVLDISHNFIQLLWVEDTPSVENLSKYAFQTIVKKPLKEVWIAKNPLWCNLSNFDFLDYLEKIIKTKIVDKNEYRCYAEKEIRHNYLDKFECIILIIALIFILKFVIVTILMLKYKRNIYSFLKNSLINITNSGNVYNSIVIRYAEIDEEFIMEKVLPTVVGNKEYIIKGKIKNKKKNEISLVLFLKHFVPIKNTTVVLFSPNYLTSVYSEVSIKKIRGEMLKAKNTVYIFADNGADNSIYAFLKEQRDRRMTILWGSPDFENTLSLLLTSLASTDKHRTNIGSSKIRSAIKNSGLGKGNKKLLAGLNAQSHFQILQEFNYRKV